MAISLLEAAADCDIQNANGNTALHLAAVKGALFTTFQLFSRSQMWPDGMAVTWKLWSQINDFTCKCKCVVSEAGGGI